MKRATVMWMRMELGHSLSNKNIPDSESLSSATVATRLVMYNATVLSELTRNEVDRFIVILTQLDRKEHSAHNVQVLQSDSESDVGLVTTSDAQVLLTNELSKPNY